MTPARTPGRAFAAGPYGMPRKTGQEEDTACSSKHSVLSAGSGPPVHLSRPYRLAPRNG